MPVLRVVAGLFGIVAWIGFLALQRGWRVTFGWLFNTLAGLLDAITIPIPFHSDLHPFGAVAHWLRSLDHNVYSQLGVLAIKSENLAVWLFSRLRYALAWVGKEIEGLAADLLTQILRLIYVYIPRWLAQFGRRLAQGFARTWKYLRATIPTLRRYVNALRRNLVKSLARTFHKLAAFAKLERWILGKFLSFERAVNKRLLNLLLAFVPKRFRKWLLATFAPLGIIWLLSQNWIRLGKAIVKWSHDHLSAWIAYFVHWTEPQDIATLIGHCEALVPVVLKEIDFLASLSDPEKLAPGPTQGPPIT